MERTEHPLKILDLELGAGNWTGLRAASPGWTDGGVGVNECVSRLGKES